MDGGGVVKFRMELRVLKYFLMAAREENITKAAEILHVTQPTLSRQLADLEDELGVKLFERKSRKIHLTQAGLLLKRSAEEITALEKKARAQFAKNTAGVSGTLSFACGELASMDELASLLRSFREKHPAVRFEIFSGSADGILERVEKGLFDFALLLEPVDLTSYEFVKMNAAEQWCALIPAASLLASLPSLTPADLYGVPLILSSRGNVRNQLLNWLARAENELSIAATANLPYNGAAAVRSGLGVSLTLALGCRYNGVKAVPLSPPLEHASVLAWKRGLPHSPVVEEFIAFVRNSYEQ